jgi:hypothetical protein
MKDESRLAGRLARYGNHSSLPYSQQYRHTNSTLARRAGQPAYKHTHQKSHSRANTDTARAAITAAGLSSISGSTSMYAQLKYTHDTTQDSHDAIYNLCGRALFAETAVVSMLARYSTQMRGAQQVLNGREKGAACRVDLHNTHRTCVQRTTTTACVQWA